MCCLSIEANSLHSTFVIPVSSFYLQCLQRREALRSVRLDRKRRTRVKPGQLLQEKEVRSQRLDVHQYRLHQIPPVSSTQQTYAEARTRLRRQAQTEAKAEMVMGRNSASLARALLWHQDFPWPNARAGTRDSWWSKCQGQCTLDSGNIEPGT
jgi:hypothetical protein